MPDVAANENRNESIKADGWLFAIFLSITASVAIFFIGALILPSDDNIASFLGVICLAVASKVLMSEFPGVFPFDKPSFRTITLAFIAGLGIQAVLWRLPLPEGYLTDYFSYNFLERIIYAIVSCVVYPIAEEIYFRGLLFPILTLRFGILTGAVFSVFPFVLYHMTLSGSLSLAILGAVSTWLVFSSRTIIPSIVLHITYNSIWLIHALMALHK